MTQSQRTHQRRDPNFHLGEALISSALRSFSQEAQKKKVPQDSRLESAHECIGNAMRLGFEVSHQVPIMRARAILSLASLVHARDTYATLEGREEIMRAFDSFTKEQLYSDQNGRAMINILERKLSEHREACSERLLTLMSAVATVSVLLQHTDEFRGMDCSDYHNGIRDTLGRVFEISRFRHSA